MKRQFAVLMALTVLVSMWAAAEERKTGENPQPDPVETEFAEPEQLEEAPDPAAEWEGEWMDIPQMMADIYLPAGWTLTDASETGFTVVEGVEDGVTPASIVLTLEPFEDESLEAYADACFEDYTVAEMHDGSAVVVENTEEDTLTMLFLHGGDELVRMILTPASNTDMADRMPDIARTFKLYPRETISEQSDASEAVGETAQE